ncbi:MAG: SAM-dependent methyltransferase [Rhodospirillaceae bacterium]|nr:MAG: SAM-dependent methyltransferase [Rhodospirillaceae bacterium]
MTQIDFIQKIHTTTKRDYVGRVLEADKSECATLAKQFGKDYWDGERKTGYGGYSYDGRWKPIAEEMAKYYGLKPGMRILDVGCGKGFLLYEFTQVVPGIEVVGLDISEYAIKNGKEEVRSALQVGHAKSLPFENDSFDFVVSLGTLHNLPLPDLIGALQEIQRVGRSPQKYVMVESYRNEREKMNLLYWQLTCESFFAPEEWEWVFTHSDYDGDHGYIYFE